MFVPIARFYRQSNILTAIVAGDNDTTLATTAFLTTASIRTDVVQSLTSAQQAQARKNINAAPMDALAYTGLQINGAMEVSQEAGDNAVSTTNMTGFTADGFQAAMVGSGVSSITRTLNASLPGFRRTLYFNCTTANPLSGSTDYQMISQSIEGYRWTRLAYGTSSPQSVTIAFWIYSGVAGTMAVSVRNTDVTRSYVANVPVTGGLWEYKTVTIPGCTDGIWQVDTNRGSIVTLCFGTGSGRKIAANTWVAVDGMATASTTNFFATATSLYITGFLVLPGSDAPTAAGSYLIRRSYDQELPCCMRYYEIATGSIRTVLSSIGFAGTTTPFTEVKRAAPTCVFASNGSVASGANFHSFTAITFSSVGTQFSGTAGADAYNYGYFVTADARMT